MSLTDIQNQLARGIVLGLLKDGTKVSDSTISLAVRTSSHVQVSHSQIRNAMLWLDRESLISLEHVGGFYVGKIREAGKDYLEGRTFIDGIQRVPE